MDTATRYAASGSGIWTARWERGWRLRNISSLDFTFDFYNMFNHANFNAGAGSLTGSAVSFGVISSTAVPANRQSSSRWIMFGARLEF